MATLKLKQGIIYGPVDSRRLGNSLGINLSPVRDKLCSFNCVYCQYGRTRRLTTDCTADLSDLPGREDVINAVGEALVSDLVFEYLTFSGNGEPTLHPDFPEIVRRVRALRDRHRPDVKIALLSNSSAADRPAVRDAIAAIDLPIMKLDAGSPSLFRAISRPAAGVEFDDVVSALTRLGPIMIQTMLVDGKPSNVTDAALADYIAAIGFIRPRQVQLFSTDRPAAETSIVTLSRERLREISLSVQQRAGVPCLAFRSGSNTEVEPVEGRGPLVNNRPGN